MVGLQSIVHTGACLALLLGDSLSALLQRLVVLLGRLVSFDGLLAVRRELRLPMAISVLVFLHQVILVLAGSVRVCVVGITLLMPESRAAGDASLNRDLSACHKAGSWAESRGFQKNSGSH